MYTCINYQKNIIPTKNDPFTMASLRAIGSKWIMMTPYVVGGSTLIGAMYESTARARISKRCGENYEERLVKAATGVAEGALIGMTVGTVGWLTLPLAPFWIVGMAMEQQT